MDFAIGVIIGFIIAKIWKVMNNKKSTGKKKEVVVKGYRCPYR